MVETRRLGDVVADARLNALFDYWKAIRGERSCPALADLDPAKIPRLLPVLYLIDVLADPRRFRYRLIGTELAVFTGRDSTGRMVDEALYEPAVLDRVLSGMNHVADTGTALLSIGSSYWVARKEWARVALLLLPLAADGRMVDMILGGIAVEPMSASPLDPGMTERYALE